MPCQHGVPECRVQMKRRLYVRPAFFFVRTTGIMPERRFRRPRLCTLHPPASRNGWSNARNLIPSDPAGPHKSAARHARLPAKRHISLAALEQARGARPRCIRTQPRTACPRSCTRRPVSCKAKPCKRLTKRPGAASKCLDQRHNPRRLISVRDKRTHTHTHSCSQSYPDV